VTERDDALDQAIDEIVARVAGGQRVHRSLGDGVRIHVERPLPFLMLYRAHEEPDDADMRRLVTSGASWLIASAAAEAHDETSRLISAIASVVGERFGAYLLLELWPAPQGRRGGGASRGVRRPSFTVACQTLPPDDPTVEQLIRALEDIPLRPKGLEVGVESQTPAHPPELPPIDVPQSEEFRLHRLGIAIQPMYRQGGTAIAFPVVYRRLRRGLTQALRQTAFHFSVTHTTHTPPHYHALGPRRTSRAVKEADRTLSEIGSAFDFLLQVTPVNLDAAWAAFSRSGGDTEPVFDYRPLVVDAPLLKRKLYSVATEEIDDPTLAHLLDDTRDELDRKVTMLTDRGTPRFLFGSQQVYGVIKPELLDQAMALLGSLPAEQDSSGERLSADDVRQLGEEELAWYRSHDPTLASTTEIRGDVSGLMVSSGNLLIGSSVSMTAHRARALVQHEVGTHVVTYHNGCAQPLRLLATGLAGYEELQEGLAVLAEWMVGGLNVKRLRQLAGRVLAVQRVIDGVPFIDTWRELTERQGFVPATAFTLCARVYRSGGFTKDAIYLRGLVRLLRYFAEGGALEPLLVGKIAFEHISMMEELRWRGVLNPPRLMPRYLTGPLVEAKLARLRDGLTVPDLLEGEDQ
jgi:uncharacterized protein (TIGR02421 family)